MASDYEYESADDVMAAHTDGGVAEADAKAAKKAGVVEVAHVNYEGALANYEARSDVEPLAERRAREVGASFKDAKFRRQVGKGSGAVTTSAKVSGDEE